MKVGDLMRIVWYCKNGGSLVIITGVRQQPGRGQGVVKTQLVKNGEVIYALPQNLELASEER
jgi:hypothetical protein